MSEFKRGDIVDITIKGVRVAAEHMGVVSIVADHPDGKPAHYNMPPQAKVERVAPAEWPPRPGDLWRDQLGAVWFAADLVNDGGDPAIYMLASHEDHQVVPDYCNEKYGPLTLVYREDEQDGGTR